MNLTKTQLEVLKELSKNGCEAHYMPYMGSFRPSAYWFLSSNHKRCTKQIEKLIKLGFVNRIQRSWNSIQAIISKKGLEKIGTTGINKKSVPAKLASGEEEGIP